MPKAASLLLEHDDSAAYVVLNAQPATTEPAAVFFRAANGEDRLFVFTVANNQLYAQSIGHAYDWSQPVVVGPAMGDPAAVHYNQKAHVFVRNPSTGWLISYTYSLPTGWSSMVTQRRQVGNTLTLPIAPTQGIGVTTGYIRTFFGTAERMVALMPMTDGQIELATYNDSTGRWDFLDNSAWELDERPFTNARPSIAYVPFAPNSVTTGRFFIAWRRSDDDLYGITFTEGNDERFTAISRKLIVNGMPTYIWNQWQYGDGSPSLLYDLIDDTNLRAAWTYDRRDPEGRRWAFFTRFADQIFDGVLKDQNDHPIIRANLSCSIKGTPCQ